MPEIGLQAFALIGKEEGIKGYWKGNLPQVFAPFSQSHISSGFLVIAFFRHQVDYFLLMVQVIWIIPYSAVQLFALEKTLTLV